MAGIIIKQENGTTVFQPDRPGAKPGDPLKVIKGDLITWNNRTNDIHHPVAVTPAGTFLTDEIPPKDVSSPIFSPVTPSVITYMCSRHPDDPGEKGSIEVSDG